jgi:hypothetical protein
MYLADAPTKSNPLPDETPLCLSGQDFRKLRAHARISRFLTWPVIALRVAMLKLALATCSLDGLIIEAVNTNWLGDPVTDQYHACIRAQNDMARLVAEVTVHKADDHGNAALIIHIRKIRLPYYAMKMRWVESAERQEEAQP